MSAIDEVKQKTDIVEVIGQYVSLSKSGRNFRGLCPFHSEKHPSFFVYPEQGSWHCFGACNTGGDAFSFIMRKEGIDFGEALRRLAERAGVSLPARTEPGPRRDEKERLYQINEAATQYFHDLLLNSPAAEKARNYVAGRGLSLETVTKFKLGYSLSSWEALKQHLTDIGYTAEELMTAGLIIAADSGETHDRFRNRLMFPLCDLKGNVTGFGARVLDDSLPKYVNSPQTIVFDKSSTLYGINLAAPAIRTQDTVVIVEGYMDVITAHQHGFDNVIATMGTAVTEKQINTLKKLTKNIILALDADTAGEAASQRGGIIAIQPAQEALAPMLYVDPKTKEPLLNEAQVSSYRRIGTFAIDESALNIDVRVIELPEGKDPDSLIKEDPQAWQNLLGEATPIIDYIFDKVTAGLDMTQARDKTLATGKLLPIIAAIKEPIRQAHYLQKLAYLVNVTERRLEAELARLKPSPSRRRGEAPKQEAASQLPRLMLSSPIEEYCLALLLQYPELKRYEPKPSPEHFENSENREIFASWQQASDLSALKSSLDPALGEHLDYLLDYLKKKEVPTNQIEQRYADCVLNLRKKYLQNLEVRRAETLALEVELKGAGADIARLEEEGIDTAIQLKEVFSQKRGKHQGAKK
jgi:DNA primase